MKKSFMIITVTLLSALFILSGCSGNEREENGKSDYSIQLYGENDTDFIKTNVDIYKIHDEEYEDGDLSGNEISVDWLGDTYKGKYKSGTIKSHQV